MERRKRSKGWGALLVALPMAFFLVYLIVSQVLDPDQHARYAATTLASTSVSHNETTSATKPEMTSAPWSLAEASSVGELVLRPTSIDTL